MAPDGYLRRVLVDGARPFRYRGRIRVLLGEPPDTGVTVAFAPVLPGRGFVYARSGHAEGFSSSDEVPSAPTRWLTQPVGDLGISPPDAGVAGSPSDRPSRRRDPAAGVPPPDAANREPAVGAAGLDQSPPALHPAPGGPALVVPAVVIPGTTQRHRPGAQGGPWQGAEGGGGYAPRGATGEPPYPAQDGGPRGAPGVPDGIGPPARPAGSGRDEPGSAVGGEPRRTAAPATPATRLGLPRAHARPDSPGPLPGGPGGYAPPVTPGEPPNTEQDGGPRGAPGVPDGIGPPARPAGSGRDEPGSAVGGEPRRTAAPATRLGLPRAHARPDSPGPLGVAAPLSRRDSGAIHVSGAAAVTHREGVATGFEPPTIGVPISARMDGEARGAEQPPAEPPCRRAASRPPPASEASWVRPPEPPAPPPQITVVAATEVVVTHAFWERAHLSRLQARILR